MNSKNKKKLIVAAAAGAALCWGYLKKSGVVNRLAYSSEHEAVARYVESHYSGAAYSQIQPTAHGCMTVVTKQDGSRIVLTFEKAYDGAYVFSETPFCDKNHK